MASVTNRLQYKRPHLGAGSAYTTIKPPELCANQPDYIAGVMPSASEFKADKTLYEETG